MHHQDSLFHARISTNGSHLPVLNSHDRHEILSNLPLMLAALMHKRIEQLHQCPLQYKRKPIPFLREEYKEICLAAHHPCLSIHNYIYITGKPQMIRKSASRGFQCQINFSSVSKSVTSQTTFRKYSIKQFVFIQLPIYLQYISFVYSHIYSFAQVS